jgi:dissimilatory sulfite reductase (desulfoviridin) alpha/beta subunit
VAGLAKDELIDVSPIIADIKERFIGDPALQNLPRKFKSAITGHPSQDVVHEINDVSFVAVEHPEYGVGFDLWVGGGLSTNPHLAERLGVWVAPERVAETWHGVCQVFRDYGYRRQRNKARLKFLVMDWGVEKFRSVLETEYLSEPLPDGPAAPQPKTVGDHVGVHEQKDGKFYIGAAPKVGRISGQILLGLADLLEANGSGRLAFTAHQKLVVLDVPAENVATDYNIEREAQDRMALASQMKAVAAQKAGHLAREITTVSIPQKKGDPLLVDTDEHPRETSLESLAKLKGVVRPDGTVTAGNASGVNDGACALLLANESNAAKYGLTPKARVVGMATAGVAPRVMGIGPAPATLKVLAQTGLTLEQLDVIELNEAFAAQGLAVLRMLGLQDDDARVNAWGGAIALGHPLGASGARLATTAVNRLHATGGRYALCTMCIGVGQGIALILERV